MNEASVRSVNALSWPLLLQLMFTSLIGLVDMYVLSRVSDHAFAAVGAVNTVVMFVNIMFSFLGQSAGLVYAQCLGAQQQHRARQYHTAALCLHLGVGLLISSGLYRFAGVVASAIGLEGELLDHGVIYLRIVGGATGLYSMVAMFAGIMSARGYTRRTMSVAVVTNLVNIALLYVIVLSPSGPRWGVRGVALSSAFAVLAGIIYNLWLALYRLEIRFAAPASLRDLAADAKHLLGVAVPTTLEPLLWHAAQIITTMIITTLGPDVIAARMYTLTITNLIGLFSVALAQGVQIFIGHLAGAGDFERLRSVHRSAMRLGALTAFGLAALTALGGGWIMRCLATGEHVVATGRLLLALGLLYLPGSSVIMTTSAALRAVGDLRFPVYVGVAVLWGLFLPLAYTLAIWLGLGVTGVLVAMAVDDNLRAVLVHQRWRSITSPESRHVLCDRSRALRVRQ